MRSAAGSGPAASSKAQRLVGQLRAGVAALHGVCKGVEVVCRGPKPRPGEVQQQVRYLLPLLWGALLLPLLVLQVLLMLLLGRCAGFQGAWGCLWECNAASSG